MTRTPSEIDHLSQSSIKTFLDCERMWAAFYLDELPRRPGVALLKGSAVDKVAEHNWRLRMDGYDTIELEEAKHLAEDFFRNEVDRAGGRGEVDWGNDTFPGALDSSVRMAERHMKDHAPLITPTAVQKKLSRRLPDGRQVIGFLDAVDENGNAVDVKTGGRALNQEDANRDLQPTAYNWLLNNPGRFRYFRVIDSGRSPVRSEVVETYRGERALSWFETLATNTSKRIDAGDYITRPGWHCRFCPLRDTCVDALISDGDR
jgi:hypothetical protein